MPLKFFCSRNISFFLSGFGAIPLRKNKIPVSPLDPFEQILPWPQGVDLGKAQTVASSFSFFTTETFLCEGEISKMYCLHRFAFLFLSFFLPGTDGTTTLGDAWWLSLEDISLPETSDLVTLSDLEKQLAVQHQPAIGPPPPPLLSLGSGQQSQQQQYERPAAVGPLAGVNGSYWAGLPSSLQTVVPQLANTALTTLKGRLGYPAVPGGGDALASVPTTSAGSSVFAPPVGDAVDDEGLISLGRSLLGVDTTREELVLAAREYLSSVLPSELKLGSLPILMTDYRRIARAGWAVAVATLGPDALFHTDTLLSGRYMHWTAEDIRMKDVASILEDYRKLLAAVASGGDIGGGGQLKEEVVTEEEEEDSFIAGPPPSSEQYQEQQEHTNE